MGQYALLRRLTESGLETNPYISDRIVRLSVRIAGHIADRLSLAANAAIEIQIRCVCVCVCGWLVGCEYRDKSCQTVAEVESADSVVLPYHCLELPIRSFIRSGLHLASPQG